MMDNLFNDMEQNRKLEEMEEELERQREAEIGRASCRERVCKQV